jgi:ceramide glucosyltransferase
MSLLVLAASVAIHLLVLSAFLVARRRRRPRELQRGPRVTIMKPLAGADEDLAANLESFAAIDYPAFEVLFGVADPEDPAAPIVRRFLARNPRLNARLIVTDPHAALNPKVAQLIGLERVATGEVLVISDSNVRVRPSYLFDLIGELSQDGVGLVSSVVVGTGERSVGAAVENLHLMSFIAPGVLAATVLTESPLTIGKSMAMRRRDLLRVGGLASVSDVLAEDYVLGRAFKEAGYGVVISQAAVENRNVDCALSRTVERHTRWAKMRRAIAPVAFWLEPLSEPVVVGTIVAALTSSATLLAASILFRVATVAICQRALRGRITLGVLLEPLRAYVAALCWIRSALSRRVEWRGHAFVLGEDSRLIPTSDAIEATS